MGERRSKHVATCAAALIPFAFTHEFPPVGLTLRRHPSKSPPLLLSSCVSSSVLHLHLYFVLLICTNCVHLLSIHLSLSLSRSLSLYVFLLPRPSSSPNTTHTTHEIFMLQCFQRLQGLGAYTQREKPEERGTRQRRETR